jgi:hypothetical protein
MAEQSFITDKTNVNIAYQYKNVEEINNQVSLLDNRGLELLEADTKAKIKQVRARLDVIKIRSGRAISKRAYEGIQTHHEIAGAFEEDEQIFMPDWVEGYDPKTKQTVQKLVYSDKGTACMRDVVSGKIKEAIPIDDFEGAQLKLNKLTSREKNAKQYLRTLQQIIDAIDKKRVDEANVILEAKKVKNVKLGELGKRLLKGHEKQQVSAIVPTPAMATA